MSLKDESKYYYITKQPNSLLTHRNLSRLEKWNLYFDVEVYENVDFEQHIEIIVNKLHEKNIIKPKSTEFEKVKPVIEEIFLHHYSLALKFI